MRNLLPQRPTSANEPAKLRKPFSAPRSRFWNSSIVYSVSLALIFNPAVSNAGVAVDGAAPASHQASVSNAGNGVPIVDIVAPTAKGVSHNKFNQFDIDPQGLILNNNRAVVDTQLAGHINANPNLTGAAASIILNEVTSTNRSFLNGLAEIAGQSAEFVLANPNGITCNGCGFINTPRATLTTGVPTLLDGGLQGFSVSGGDVSISGLNASSIDRLDVFTRAITLNDKLHAKQLNMITGRNDINYSDLAVTAKADDGSAKPAFALDVAALGGMYANQIFMIGTESGLGVNMQGEMASDAGDISLKADGTLSINKVVSGRNLVLESDNSDITIQGNTYSRAASSIKANQGDIVNSGNLIAETGLTVAADNLTNTHTGKIQSFASANIQLDGDFNNQTNGVDQGAFTADGALTLSANNIFNHGVLGGGDTVTLAALNTLENSADYGKAGSVLFAVGDLNLYGQTIINRQSNIFGLENIVMAGDASNNAAQSIRNSSATLESFGNLTVRANEFVNHRQGLYNFDNSDYCSTGGGFYCSFPVRNAFAFGLEDGTTTADAWLVKEMGEFIDLDWSDDTDWDNPKQSLRDAYQLLVDKVTPSSRDARVLAGQDFIVSAGAFRNEGGFISAANDFTANVGTFANVSRMAVMPFPGGWPEHSDSWLEKFEHEIFYSDYRVYYLFFEGELTAGNNITVNAVDEINNGRQFPGFSPPQTVPDLPLPKAPSSGNADSSITDQLDLAAANPFTSFLDLPPGSDFDRIDVDISLPPSGGDGSSSGGGLFTYTDPATGQSNTLIATNLSVARFVNVQGSDYLLNLLGLNPDETTKRLGDGFYESRLIRQAIQSNTGSRFLHDSFVSDAQQYRYLMESAARAAEDLQLSIGVALTHDQILNLTHDMVWLEEKEVNGEIVLVPTLYLARMRPGSFDRDGATLTAKNIVLNSGGEITNVARISSTQDLSLKAKGDIKNIGGRIEGENVAIVTEKGDFLHTVNEGRTAYLVANNDLLIKTGRDINVLGSEVHVGGNGQLNAGRDLNVESTKAESTYKGEYFWKERNGVTSRYTETEQRNSAQVLIAGDAAISTGRDLNLKGAELSIGGNAAVGVGRDLNVESVTNRTTVEVREKYLDIKEPKREGGLAGGYVGFDTKKKIRSDVITVTDTYTEQASQFNVGGNLALNTGNNVNLVASKLAAEGDVDMSIGGNLGLVSKNNRSETRAVTKDEYIRTSSLGFSKSSSSASSSSGASGGTSGSRSVYTGPGIVNTAGAKSQTASQKQPSTIAVLDRTGSFKEFRAEQSAKTLNSNRASLISGGDADITVKGNVTSRRSDVSGGDTTIKSGGSIRNVDKATISAGDLSLAANDDIENSGGSSIRGDNLRLVAGNDITNKRDVTQAILRDGDFITTNVSTASEIEASGDLSMDAGRDISNQGSRLSSGGEGQLTAGRNIVIGAVADRERRADNKDDISDDTRHIGSQVLAEEGLGLSADDSVSILGSDIRTKGNLTIRAGNNVEIASVTDKHYRFIHDEDSSGFSKSSETTEIFKTTNVASNVEAEGDIDIKAEDQDFVLKGSSLRSGGDITVEAGGKAVIEAAQEIYDYRHEESKSSLGGLVSSSSNIERYQENYIGANSKSAGDTSIKSDGDIRIVASRIDSEKDINLTSTGGKIALLSKKDVDQFSLHEQDSGSVKQVIKGEGYTHETTRHTELSVGGKLSLNAAQGFVADIQQKEGETLQQSMSRLGADNPDLQWMQDLASRDDVAWQRVQEIHDTWEYEHESISPAAALIISIAVGMALPAGGLLAGEGIGATVANAGLNQLATQASISLVNNGGDIGAVLKELGSNESIKGLVTASVTAGLGEGILKPGFNSNVSWQSNLGNELYNAGIYATVDTAVHGGSLQDNLEQRLTSALVDWSSKTVTNSIGDTSGAESIITESSWEEGGWQKTLAHALVGCASASAKSQDCGSAATASAVAEIMSPWLSENGFDDQADAIILDVTNIAVASLAKQDVDVAVESGRRVEKYNRQLHYEEAQALRSLIENNPDESEKLRASACLQIKCAEGVSENDPKYPELQKLQELGEILKASNDEAYVAFDMAAKESGLFEYKLIDYANDFITSNEQSVSRALGALQAGSATIGTIGGGAITITSTAACVTTIAGCVVTVGGAALTAAESYRLYQGLERALGGHTYTSGQRVLDSFSPDTHQGEFDPLSVAAQEAGIALVEVGAGKFAIKVADKIHDVSAVDFGKVGGDSAGPDKLPDFDLSKVDPPKGKSYDGTVHRYEKPEYVETTWDQHQGNIDASHRYTGEGQGGVYAGTSQQTALDEIKYYDINAEDLRVPVNQDVKLDNVLDLTDQSVRDRIGVDLDDITNSTDYTKTQQIGNWAKKNGYDGILAPSARNPEGSNIVILKND